MTIFCAARHRSERVRQLLADVVVEVGGLLPMPAQRGFSVEPNSIGCPIEGVTRALGFVPRQCHRRRLRALRAVHARRRRRAYMEVSPRLARAKQVGRYSCSKWPATVIFMHQQRPTLRGHEMAENQMTSTTTPDVILDLRTEVGYLKDMAA